jgi:D-alanine-D-alanine ligase
MEKIRIGVIFGGSSREREVSFAGGRTVYDNLNKSVFEAIPLFVDSFGNIILLSWEFVYKGSVRDFYPPADQLPASVHDFQVYAESLGDLDKQEQIKLIHKIGNKVDPGALSGLVDIAFLCLHGTDGEDGRIQGLLEFLRIPYTGSGILPSAIGMNKAVQKELMRNAGFEMPEWLTIRRDEWIRSRPDLSAQIQHSIKLPCVVKAANQGSSIGISILSDLSADNLAKAIDKSFFIRRIKRSEWESLDFNGRVSLVRALCDIREGVGIPLRIKSRVFYHPEELLSALLDLFSNPEEELVLEALEGESEVLIESFIEGKEFSCIVIEDESGNPVALPPTEIRKGKEMFDYRSKYLPGLSRKITPILLPDADINRIRTACEKLYADLRFDVYARIDGFITAEGKVFLNDPNTTSGMMPSSFFFHQAAEIGLNPSQFITYILRTSLRNRIRDFRNYRTLPDLLKRFDQLLEEVNARSVKKVRTAVILGGYSSERHISVESGRNIYEKLSSSTKYEPFPVFLTGSDQDHQMYRIPVSLLLKDNADDIREKAEHYEIHPVILDIIRRCESITSLYAASGALDAPRRITYEELAGMADEVFIALHGRPGEDGSVQQKLIALNIPFNGSGPDSSQITIDKYRTNELLRLQGLLVAHHRLVYEEDWKKNPAAFFDYILQNFSFPFVAKPVDDGCSSAVKIVRNREELEAYVQLIFRSAEELPTDAASVLRIKAKEEFPKKNSILLEDLITANGAQRFLEITGGMLTTFDENGKISYEVFEASEALSEGDVLSLEEKFLAGQGQNITPARYSPDPAENKKISAYVKKELEKAARILSIEGYARIDAFVRIFGPDKVEVIFIEVNSLPGMTPATCIFHQAAIAQYKPYEFIDRILDFSLQRGKISARIVS